MLLWIASALVHLVVVAAAAAGMARVDNGEHFRSGRSTGTLGHSVLVHGRTSYGLLRCTVDSLSTVVCSVAALGGGGQGGDMAGRR